MMRSSRMGLAWGAALLMAGPVLAQQAGERFMGAPQAPPADTAASYNSRPGLRAFVNAYYDDAEGILRDQTAPQRAEVIQMFSVRVPRWQVWDELHQHTFWTAGQVVANFRKHGMAPPGFGFF